MLYFKKQKNFNLEENQIKYSIIVINRVKKDINANNKNNLNP